MLQLGKQAEEGKAGNETPILLKNWPGRHSSGLAARPASLLSPGSHGVWTQDAALQVVPPPSWEMEVPCALVPTCRSRASRSHSVGGPPPTGVPVRMEQRSQAPGAAARASEKVASPPSFHDAGQGLTTVLWGQELSRQRKGSHLSCVCTARSHTPHVLCAVNASLTPWTVSKVGPSCRCKMQDLSKAVMGTRFLSAPPRSWSR